MQWGFLRQLWLHAWLPMACRLLMLPPSLHPPNQPLLLALHLLPLLLCRLCRLPDRLPCHQHLDLVRRQQPLLLLLALLLRLAQLVLLHQ